ncbi:MAG TPA: hypothetical protein VGR25_03120 [bacterium]|jgi:hypothetical protein|nr:hypothetical protein [bacterium]
MADAVLTELQRILLEALELRRGLIAYSKIEAAEMDRLARDYEQQALDRVRGELERLPSGGVALAVRQRLGQMDEALAVLADRSDIAERSRRLERDDITWRTFEDVASLLGIEP